MQFKITFLSLCIATVCIADIHVVNCGGMSFSPETITVQPGDTIKWQYTGGFPHTATSGASCAYDGLFHGTVAKFNPVFEWIVPNDVPEVIPYYCIPHCNDGMTGTIYVDGVFACNSDIDGDGFVDVTDLLAVIDAWGQSDTNADINDDGDVNVSDVLQIVSDWGAC
ncbi:MAG: plastocyanin/azurin family copper-binding protein [Planctomycetota bacterium]|nr:plastocyanin/azurin family copper-binding protein [Planctomycetota bacterium]